MHCSTLYPQLFLNQTLQNEPTIRKWFNNAEDIRSGTEIDGLKAFNIYYDIESFDYRWMRSKYSLGAEMKIHHHLDQPSKFGFIDVSPGHYNTISILPTLYKTTQRAIDRFSIQERQCLDESDVTFELLPQPFRVSLDNCYQEAYFQSALEHCNCLTLDQFPHPEIPTCMDEQFDCLYNASIDKSFNTTHLKVYQYHVIFLS